MHRKIINLSPGRIGFLLALAATLAARGMTVSELQTNLAQGVKLTVIDVRSPILFGHGHIPGAINLPASLCGPKHLPPLGHVVVYDAGLGRDATDAAVLALDAKPGITADVLDGGFAAWETAQGVTTRTPGLKLSAPNYITYQQLKAARTSDYVLVDLRSSSASNQVVSAKVAVTPSSGPTDLTQEFPGAKTVRSPFNSNLPSGVAPKAAVAGSAGSATPPLLVLIDDGDGQAQEMARTLQANGVKRYVILTGGELILSRHGESGLKREGFNAANASVSTSALSGAATK